MDYWSNYSADARILTWAWENVGNIGTFFLWFQLKIKIFMSFLGGQEGELETKFFMEPKKL